MGCSKVLVSSGTCLGSIRRRHDGVFFLIENFSLNSLWSRPAWLAYFIMVVLFTASAYIVSLLLRSLLSSRASFSPLASPSLELPTSRSSSPNPLVKSYKKLTGIWGKFERFAVGKLEVVFQRTDDAKVTWLQGIGWAVAGGSLAGLCLVFTKAVVKIMWLPGHPVRLFFFYYSVSYYSVS